MFTKLFKGVEPDTAAILCGLMGLTISPYLLIPAALTGYYLAKKNKMTTIKTPDGNEHTLTPVDFTVDCEPWMTLNLADGTILKCRTTIAAVERSDQYDALGNPMYFVKDVKLMRHLKIPDKLKKKVDKPVEKDIAGYS